MRVGSKIGSLDWFCTAAPRPQPQRLPLVLSANAQVPEQSAAIRCQSVAEPIRCGVSAFSSITPEFGHMLAPQPHKDPSGASTRPSSDLCTSCGTTLPGGNDGPTE